ncbi:hypothetical protein LSPH24S_09306 [Lysinibacillus sphaericus]
MDIDTYRLITENDGTDVSETDYTFCEFESTEAYEFGYIGTIKGKILYHYRILGKFISKRVL